MLNNEQLILEEKENNSLFNRIKSLFKNEKVAQGFAIGSIVLSGGLLATRLLNKAKK